MTKEQKIHPELQAELKKIKDDYSKVTSLAKALPLFAESIISQKITGDSYHKFTERYKTLPLAWGICLQKNKPTNYPEGKEHPKEGLICVYINCMNLFKDDLYYFSNSKLNEAVSGIKVHFFDNLNSTFYFKFDELEEGLEKLHLWYTEVKSLAHAEFKRQKKLELEKQLKELQ